MITSDLWIQGKYTGSDSFSSSAPKNCFLICWIGFLADNKRPGLWYSLVLVLINSLEEPIDTLSSPNIIQVTVYMSQHNSNPHKSIDPPLSPTPASIDCPIQPTNRRKWQRFSLKMFNCPHRFFTFLSITTPSILKIILRFANSHSNSHSPIHL